MTIGVGYKAKAAWAKEGELYGSPVTCSSLIPFVSESLNPLVRKHMDNSVMFGAGHGFSKTENSMVSGNMLLQGVYRGLESLIVSALGFSDHIASPELVSTGVYKHSFTPDNCLHTEEWMPGYTGYKIRRGTLCIDKEVSILNYASCMLNAMLIKCDPSGVFFDFDLLARAVYEGFYLNNDSSDCVDIYKYIIGKLGSSG